MSAISRNEILISQDQFILVLPPAGKPDPSIPCNEENFYTRERVKQSAQKGITCWYYTMRMLCDSVGKNPVQTLCEKRKIDQCISMRRKGFSLTYTNVSGFLKALENSPGLKQARTRSQCKNILKGLEHLKNLREGKLEKYEKELVKLKDFQFLSNNVMVKGSKALEVIKTSSPQTEQKLAELILKEFCEQNLTDDINEYVNSGLGKYRINIDFLKMMEVQIEPLYKEMYLDSKDKNKKSELNLLLQPWKNLDIKERSSFLSIISYRVAYQALNFKESEYDPAQPIEKLILLIKENGPQIFAGSLGTNYYKERPILVAQKEIKNPLYGWKPNGKHLDACDVGFNYNVVLIGARKNQDKEHVYFIDPKDGSDPACPEKRPIYILSYAKFKNYINRLNGLATRNYEKSHLLGKGVYSIYQ